MVRIKRHPYRYSEHEHPPTAPRKSRRIARVRTHVPAVALGLVREYAAVDDFQLWCRLADQVGPDRTDTRGWWFTGGTRALAHTETGCVQTLVIPDGGGRPRTVHIDGQGVQPIVRLLYNGEDIRIARLFRDYQLSLARSHPDPLAKALRGMIWQHSVCFKTEREEEMRPWNEPPVDPWDREDDEVLARRYSQFALLATCVDCKTHGAALELMGIREEIMVEIPGGDPLLIPDIEKYTLDAEPSPPGKVLSHRGSPNQHLYTSDKCLMCPLSWRWCIMPNWGTNRNIKQQDRFSMLDAYLEGRRMLHGHGQITVPSCLGSTCIQSWDKWDNRTNRIHDQEIFLYFHVGIEQAMHERDTFDEMRQDHHIYITLPTANRDRVDLYAFELRHLMRPATQVCRIRTNHLCNFDFVNPDVLYI